VNEFNLQGVFIECMKIFVKAHPKSKKIQVLQKDTDHYEVWVREAPDKGQANQAVIKALSEHLGLARSRLSLSSGLASRHKVILIT
jgi:uncharacterized protein YggU (UPF0235/DUF167 family)